MPVVVLIALALVLVPVTLAALAGISTALDRRETDGGRIVGAAVFAAAAIAIALVIVGLSIASAAKAQTLAERAAQHLPTLVAEQRAHWPDAPQAYTMAGQVEAESAWRPTAELKTSREHGAGLAQLTRVVRPDGSVVFDRLADARRLHPSLADWTWDDRFDAARQLRAMVLMMRAEWAAITGAAGPTDRWAFALAAYNGGRAGMQRDRALCAGTAGCDPSMWFLHTELHSWRSKVTTPEYGRSFFDINRAYVRSIVTERRYRYAWGWA